MPAEVTVDAEELDILKQIAQEAYWQNFGECRNVHQGCSLGSMPKKLQLYDEYRLKHKPSTREER